MECPCCHNDVPKFKIGVETISPQLMTHWFLGANLKQIGQLQTLLAREGFELHIATAPVVMELPPGTFER